MLVICASVLSPCNICVQLWDSKLSAAQTIHHPFFVIYITWATIHVQILPVKVCVCAFTPSTRLASYLKYYLPTTFPPTFVTSHWFVFRKMTFYWSIIKRFDETAGLGQKTKIIKCPPSPSLKMYCTHCTTPTDNGLTNSNTCCIFQLSYLPTRYIRQWTEVVFEKRFERALIPPWSHKLPFLGAMLVL